MPFAVRRAILDVVSAVASLYVELKHHHRVLAPSSERYQVDDEAWERVAYETLDDPDKTVFVAEDEDRVVGFVGIELASKPWGISCEIETLVVEEEARGRGVGLALLRAAERFAKDVRARALRVDVLHNNDGARAFYEREGYNLFAVRYGKPVD